MQGSVDGEPQFCLLTGEILQHRLVNSSENARLDNKRTRDFYICSDMMGFDPLASSYKRLCHESANELDTMR